MAGTPIMTHNGEKQRLTKKATGFGINFNGEVFDRLVSVQGLPRTVYFADAILDRYQHAAYKETLRLAEAAV